LLCGLRVLAIAIEVASKKWVEWIGYRVVPDNSKNVGRGGAALSYHEFPENGRMGGGEGLPGASASYQVLAGIWGEEGLPGASASC